MQDHDLDALAAAFVLGKLSAAERAPAEAMSLIDSGFADIVRQWERRLGELNVMVEAVEPPPELWDKIKTEIAKPPPVEGVPLAPADDAPGGEEAPAIKSDGEGHVDANSALAALASALDPEAEDAAATT